MGLETAGSFEQPKTFGRNPAGQYGSFPQSHVYPRCKLLYLILSEASSENVILGNRPPHRAQNGPHVYHQ